MDVWRPLTIVICLLSVNRMHASSLSPDLPCEFLDSINITAGAKQANGSILFDGVLFSKDEIAEVDYSLKNGKEHISVKPHIRGCLCQDNRPCFRLCCPHGSFKQYGNGNKSCLFHEAAHNLEHEILDENNQTKTVKLHEHFKYVDHRPCEEFYYADEYQITHSGDVLHEGDLLNHKEYCLIASLNEQTNRPDLELLVCFETTEELDIRYRVLPYGMIVSVIFIIITLLVYTLIPVMRNLYGKCLLCYLVSLAVAYSLIAALQLNGSNYIQPPLCYSIAYTVYFSFLSTFLWLNVMNFDLWLNFQSTGCFRNLTDHKRLIVYMIYGFGIPCFATCLMYILDSIASIPHELQPGLGHATCFMKNEKLSKFIYYYSMLLITFILNIILFVLIALKTRQSGKIDNKEKSNPINDRYILCFRLFIVMGILWTMEVISFLISPDHPVFFWTDLCNTFHGVFVFILFICNRRVFQLMKEKIRGKKSERNNSVTVHSIPNMHVLGPINVHPSSISQENIG